MTKLFAIAILVFVASIDASIIGINRGSSCSCSHSIQKEIEDVVNKHNKIFDNFNKLAEFVTMINCNPGFSFNYNNSIIDTKTIKCYKCPENHYRTNNNSTCIHCPEGYVSHEGSIKCKKVCQIGSVVGNNKFAKNRNSCKKCDKVNREYMPYYNNADNCLVCPVGSVIKLNNKCEKCPIGHYEKNNKCIECDPETYNDIEGVAQCMVCNNHKAIAYNSMGGTNCKDSNLFKMVDNINKYIDIDIMTKPIVYGVQIGSAIIYNNRKIIQQISTIGTFIGYGVSAIISN